MNNNTNNKINKYLKKNGIIVTTKVVRTFQTDDYVYHRFKQICDEKRANIGSELTYLMIKYLARYDKTCALLAKAYSIPIPELFETAYTWKQYMRSLDKAEYEKIDEQIGLLMGINFEVGREKHFIDYSKFQIPQNEETQPKDIVNLKTSPESDKKPAGLDCLF